jgi:hypothetical protein
MALSPPALCTLREEFPLWPSSTHPTMAMPVLADRRLARLVGGTAGGTALQEGTHAVDRVPALAPDPPSGSGFIGEEARSQAAPLRASDDATSSYVVRATTAVVGPVMRQMT